jgi:AraC family transcriptional regulator, regulatory protein of adaptative response / methylated-DNA-[protein]-cysteine methyltransferase
MGAAAPLRELAAVFGLSAGHLQRRFVEAMGVSPGRYFRELRLRKFKENVRQGETVTEALYGAGFGGSSRLYEAAGKEMGMTPGAYRRKGRGMEIGYILADTPFGRMLVAGTGKGISALYLGEEEVGLLEALRNEYPEAAISAGGRELEAQVAAVVNYLAGQSGCPELPFDLQATAFQLRVWEILRRIPSGATRTYSNIAGDMGMPGASRAVARACATNPVSVLTPCHRVIRGDGKLAGYRWGLDRKKALLAWERQLPTLK